MDKIRQQKLRYFLLDLDGKIKEINTYLLLDKGAILLDAIEKFEEENAEFLQYNSSCQDDLNKRKWIIQFILFPIISDDKVEELLQYHLLEALDAGLDLEELMRRRAITISELLWPKISQQYLKALMQNTQLVGGDPLNTAGGGNSLLPYIKNWISLYNRRFGIDKHTGLEPHQFVLDDPNTARLSKDLKEKLLKILSFYESLKVHSLSEIEAELRKMRMGFVAQQAAAYSIGENRQENIKKPSGAPSTQIPAEADLSAKASGKEDIPSWPQKTNKKPTEKIAAIQKEILQDKRIKIINDTGTPKNKQPENSPTKEIIESHVLELLEKYPSLQGFRITANPISLSIAPFTLSPTIQNWIQYYFKECGRGKHSPQERGEFMEILKKSQNLGESDLQKLQKIFRSVDEKIPLPFDRGSKELLLNLMTVGSKLKIEGTLKNAPPKLRPVIKISGSGINKPESIEKDKGYLDIELVSTQKEEN